MIKNPTTEFDHSHSGREEGEYREGDELEMIESSPTLMSKITDEDIQNDLVIPPVQSEFP